MLAPEDFDLLFGDDTAIRLGGYCHPGVLAPDGSARLAPPPNALEALGLLQNSALHASTETIEWVTQVLAGQIMFDAFSATFFVSPPRQTDISEGFGHAVRHLREASSPVIKATALQFKPEAPTAVAALAYIRVLEASLVKRAQAVNAAKEPSRACIAESRDKSQSFTASDATKAVCHNVVGGAVVTPHVIERAMSSSPMRPGDSDGGSIQPPRREFANVLPGMRWKPPDASTPPKGDSKD